MSAEGFSEGILYGGACGLTEENRHKITMPADQSVTITASNVRPSWVFCGHGNREILRITPEGELIFADVTEAAIALKTEWDRLRGAW